MAEFDPMNMISMNWIHYFIAHKHIIHLCPKNKNANKWRHHHWLKTINKKLSSNEQKRKKVKRMKLFVLFLFDLFDVILKEKKWKKDSKNHAEKWCDPIQPSRLCSNARSIYFFFYIFVGTTTAMQPTKMPLNCKIALWLSDDHERNTRNLTHNQ